MFDDNDFGTFPLSGLPKSGSLLSFESPCESELKQRVARLEEDNKSKALEITALKKKLDEITPYVGALWKV